MNCSVCGIEIPVDSKFCESCGTKVESPNSWSTSEMLVTDLSTQQFTVHREKLIGWLLIVSGLIWGSSTFCSIAGSDAPIHPSSLMMLEWIVFGGIFTFSGLACLLRRPNLGLLTSLITGPIAIFDLCYWRSNTNLRLDLGILLSVFSVGIVLIAEVLGLKLLIRDIKLTRSGINHSLLYLPLILLWCIAFPPSWVITTATVTSGTFSQNGKQSTTQAGGSLFSNGASTMIFGLLIIAVLLAAVFFLSHISSESLRISGFLTIGIAITSIAADTLFDLGSRSKSGPYRDWWGWSNGGSITNTATAWLWLVIGSGVAVILLSIIFIGFKKTR